MGLFRKKNKNTEEDMVDSSVSFFHWTQEFTKKIVTISFVIFVLINFFILGLLLFAYMTTGELMYLDTLISESNQTFRDVIGGYIVKAATENIIKITSPIIDKILEKKYSADSIEVEPDVSEEETNLFNESEYNEDEDPMRDMNEYDLKEEE